MENEKLISRQLHEDLEEEIDLLKMKVTGCTHQIDKQAQQTKVLPVLDKQNTVHFLYLEST